VSKDPHAEVALLI